MHAHMHAMESITQRRRQRDGHKRAFTVRTATFQLLLLLYVMLMCCAVGVATDDATTIDGDSLPLPKKKVIILHDAHEGSHATCEVSSLCC